MGGHPEKFLTLEEAARRLRCSVGDVEAMVQSGRLPSFRLGGNLLRLRLSDVEAVETDLPKRPPSWERLADFIYFNDFYLITLLVILLLLALILAL
ncbi:MAG: helix-turn-helix domain-containing protein [Candidatus Omnitrophica bacterium]|nr:helix-turn-helix domain-containing protein [Candidatus Omnitrophota bacterium]